MHLVTIYCAYWNVPVRVSIYIHFYQKAIMKKSHSHSISKDIYISWFILASFYLYQYILRSSPGVLIEEIRHEFGMNADNFALMGSMYYYGYSLMQVPLGILVDRVGVRKTAIFSISASSVTDQNSLLR